jgi:hypothetical protein
MRKQVVLAPKQRPPGPGVQVVVRLQPDPLSALDKWAAKQSDQPTRAEAIRRLIELGLKVKTPARPVINPGRKLRAQELATKEIDKMIDPSAPPEERAQRTHRLTKGPPEFRDARVDRLKAKGK